MIPLTFNLKNLSSIKWVIYETLTFPNPPVPITCNFLKRFRFTMQNEDRGIGKITIVIWGSLFFDCLLFWFLLRCLFLGRFFAFSVVDLFIQVDEFIKVISTMWLAIEFVFISLHFHWSYLSLRKLHFHFYYFLLFLKYLFNLIQVIIF